MPLKTVILAGGFGTRLSEETTVRPKPMDSLRDKMVLEEQWATGTPPWKTW